MSSTKDQIKKLTRILYPTGRAYGMPAGGFFDKLHSGLAESEAKAYDDANAILSAILPDNDGFTVEDATDWEFRLGMITNPLVFLADRKLAILRKMNHPGDIPARQSWDFLEQSLQLAGFDVYVHENIPEQAPQSFISSDDLFEMGDDAEMGLPEMGNSVSLFPSFFNIAEMGDIEMGQIEMGEVSFNNKVANHIDEFFDSTFSTGANYRSTCFIGGQVEGTFANVDINRKKEFRQTILRIKPVQLVGFLLINYI